MSGTALAWRRTLGLLTPTCGRSRCSHCWTPWGSRSRSPVAVEYAPHARMFVVCAWCWPRTTAEQRVAYAEQVTLRLYPEKWPAIRDAYLTAR